MQLLNSRIQRPKLDEEDITAPLLIFKSNFKGQLPTHKVKTLRAAGGSNPPAGFTRMIYGLSFLPLTQPWVNSAHFRRPPTKLANKMDTSLIETRNKGTSSHSREAGASGSNPPLDVTFGEDFHLRPGIEFDEAAGGSQNQWKAQATSTEFPLALDYDYTECPEEKTNAPRTTSKMKTACAAPVFEVVDADAMVDGGAVVLALESLNELPDVDDARVNAANVEDAVPDKFRNCDSSRARIIAEINLTSKWMQFGRKVYSLVRKHRPLSKVNIDCPALLCLEGSVKVLRRRCTHLPPRYMIHEQRKIHPYTDVERCLDGAFFLRTIKAIQAIGILDHNATWYASNQYHEPNIANNQGQVQILSALLQHCEDQRASVYNLLWVASMQSSADPYFALPVGPGLDSS
ncbi:hypothetical protein B0H16DRAFT_1468798 [Mycena metata]|uniref:Uncharacterized protein n=1 Tax=Mycena metata TaxID=1033252 RepID=A0AAD7MTZ0_9AGAR|nr:hypothetical protein B0H16DRAFT_1468798 [Mycena metata]